MFMAFQVNLLNELQSNMQNREVTQVPYKSLSKQLRTNMIASILTNTRSYFFFKRNGMFAHLAQLTTPVQQRLKKDATPLAK